MAWGTNRRFAPLKASLTESDREKLYEKKISRRGHRVFLFLICEICEICGSNFLIAAAGRTA
jgi:hypothetical protein